MRDSSASGWIIGIVVLAVVWCLILLFSALATVSQDEVGFAVGGGPFDANKNKVQGELREPGRTLLGTFDGMWVYPNNKSLRFQNFEQTITTKDGKRVVIKGQVGFRFVGEKDPALAKEFAQGIGARRYGKDKQRPGESDEGWTAMLDTLVDPEIRSAFKDEFGKVYCADFEPSCRVIDPRTEVPDSNPEEVYTRVSESVQKFVDAKLGDPYFQDMRVRVKDVDLEKSVQSNINRFSAEQGKTKTAEQAKKTADAEAEIIRTKGKALRSNPQNLAIEVARECKGGCNIILDTTGGRTPVAVSAK